MHTIDDLTYSFNTVGTDNINQVSHIGDGFGVATIGDMAATDYKYNQIGSLDSKTVQCKIYG